MKAPRCCAILISLGACSDGAPEPRTDAAGYGDANVDTQDAGVLDPQREASTPPSDAAVSGGDAASDAGYDPRDPIVTIASVDPASLPQPAELPQDAPGEMVMALNGGGCMGVRGAPTAGAPVTLAVCRRVAGQLWAVDDGALSIAAAPELCLDNADGRLRLAACSALSQRWTLASDGVIEMGGSAADVTGAGELITYGTHRGDNQRWTLLSADLGLIGYTPSATSFPFAASNADRYALELAMHRVGGVQPPGALLGPRDVATFPGTVADEVARVSRRVFFDRRFDHEQAYLRVSWPNKNWRSTGLYAPAGALLAVVVPEDADVQGLFVRLNVHTDRLTPSSGNVEGGSFERMPIVSLRLPLEVGVNVLRTPYGGEVVFESLTNTAKTVALDVHGAVEMPHYVRGVTTTKEWRRRRALPVPWAELESERAVVHVPSEQIRTLDDPEPMLARYDRVVALEAELSGLDGSSPLHRMYDGKIRFVADRQITGGSGHSGYPIMATLDWNFADAETGGDEWGVWHELGHNHQQSCWASRFGGESTVNLNSLYVQRTVHDTSRIQDEYDAVIDGLTRRTLTFASADVWQKLVFLVQPVNALPDPGWEIYRRVHRAYRELTDLERTTACADEQSQLDTFYSILSTAAEVDLRDHFARWGLNVSQAALDTLSASGLPDPGMVVWQARDD